MSPIKSEKKVAIVGTQGVPATYGGFETLVEYLVRDKSDESISYQVYCSGKAYETRIEEYHGAKLVYIPLRANGIWSIPYDILSMFHAIFRSDAMLILGVSGCICLPVLKCLYRGRIVVNIDGLEHQRDKWKGVARWFLKLSESLAVRCADVIVTDNKGIQDYVTSEYGKDNELIAYGGDHVTRFACCEQEGKEMLNVYDQIPGAYALSVCRIEPENNSHMILDAFAQSNAPLVFVGNWNNSKYGRSLKSEYQNIGNITLLNPIYDLKALHALRNNCRFYIHGHSAGGTNPSLVEAMSMSLPVVAFDVVYNRETTRNQAVYFSSEEELSSIISSGEVDSEMGGRMGEIAREDYTWESIVQRYEHLFDHEH